MQAETELDSRMIGTPAPMIDHRDRVEGVARGLQRRLAYGSAIGGGADLEHDQDGVADELQDLAAARSGGHRAVLEVVVEQRQQLSGRQAFGQLGEAAQVGIPERRVDAVAVAALDLAMDDALADARADEGIEQTQGRAAHGDDFHQRRQQVRQGLEALEIGRGKAARVAGRQRHRVDRAGARDHRQGVVVGDALVAQILHQGMLALARLRVDPQMHRFEVFLHPLDRAAEIGVAAANAMLDAVAPHAIDTAPENAPTH